MCGVAAHPNSAYNSINALLLNCTPFASLQKHLNNLEYNQHFFFCNFGNYGNVCFKNSHTSTGVFKVPFKVNDYNFHLIKTIYSIF